MSTITVTCMDGSLVELPVYYRSKHWIIHNPQAHIPFKYAVSWDSRWNLSGFDKSYPMVCRTNSLRQAKRICNFLERQADHSLIRHGDLYIKSTLKGMIASLLRPIDQLARGQ